MLDWRICDLPILVAALNAVHIVHSTPVTTPVMPASWFCLGTFILRS